MSNRDLRIDFLRGLALLMIFVDHSPWNPLTILTVRTWSFGDAAELFEPAADKVYRHPTFYSIPEGIKNI